MKTEQQPAPGSPIFNSVKEVEGHLKARMEKAVSDLQHEMASIRTGRASLGFWIISGWITTGHPPR